jgi:hypothetical protein
VCAEVYLNLQYSVGWKVPEASLGGGNAVIALSTSLPADANQCPTPPQQLL